MRKHRLGLDNLKDRMLDTIKLDIDSFKYSSECITYKVSKEEMSEYLSKYKYKKGFITK